MKKKIHIVKVGGKIIDDASRLHVLLEALKQISGSKILIHGGGKTASELGLRLGIEPQMIEGRRITDEPTLDLVTMVYAGLINKKIVAQLQAQQINAVGLSGADLNVILAEKRPVQTIDYGFAGDIQAVNQAALALLIEKEIVPVLCSITHDGQGQLLNTNADTIAANVAVSLSALYEVRLLFVFEKKGVLQTLDNEDSFIRELDHSLFQTYQAQGIIHEGMIPKLDNGFEALRQGVAEVIICKAEEIHQEQPEGTYLRL